MSTKEDTKIIEQQTLLWELDTGVEDLTHLTQVSEKTEHKISSDTQIQAEEQPTIIGKNILEEQVTQIGSYSPSSKENNSSFFMGRYEQRGILGSGGMGQVLRVYDHKLHRFLALKIINADLICYPLILTLFLKEAQTTAVLQHPGIVPVHDFGTLPDGRYYFTMKEIQGVTLKEVIQLVHRSQSPSALHELRGDWSIQRLLQIFARICEAVGYAHERGVLHRDIKPDNIMLGSHGEVLIVDWGIAKLLPKGTETFGIDTSLKPSLGSVIGTPMYMSPEQAQGESPQVVETSDVFSLGAILYEILTGKEPRYGRPAQILSQAQLPLPLLPEAKYIDVSLEDIYTKATSINHKKRYANAEELYQAIQAWLEGSARRHQAELLVEEAKLFRVNIQVLGRKITERQLQIKQLEKKIERWDEPSTKQPLWDMEDKLEKLKLRENLLEINFLEKLQTALNHCPDFAPAHQTLADFYYEKHQKAEATNDLLQVHLMAQLMKLHDTGRYHNYLSGISRLQLNTKVPAQIEIFYFKEISRRLALQSVWKGKSPIDIELPVGSYIAYIKTEGYAMVQLPFCMLREKTTRLFKVVLPLEEDILEEEAYVPAGICYLGSHDEPKHPRKRVHVRDFCIQKHPVTNRQYIQFLNALIEQGKEEEALQHVPRARGFGAELGEQMYGYSKEEKSFFLQPDSEGDCWELDWPVILVTGYNAQAYAKWYSEKTGKQWTLPTCQQWEKAARGVDGRKLPWGYYFEPTWACVRGSRKGRALPIDIHEYPLDVSPFGVHGMAGNVQDLCLDPENDDMIYTKGGAWAHHPEFIDMAIQRNFPKSIRLEVAGFRLARCLEET